MLAQPPWPWGCLRGNPGSPGWSWRTSALGLHPHFPSGDPGTRQEAGERGLRPVRFCHPRQVISLRWAPCLSVKQE